MSKLAQNPSRERRQRMALLRKLFASSFSKSEKSFNEALNMIADQMNLDLLILCSVVDGEISVEKNIGSFSKFDTNYFKKFILSALKSSGPVLKSVNKPPFKTFIGNSIKIYDEHRVLCGLSKESLSEEENQNNLELLQIISYWAGSKIENNIAQIQIHDERKLLREMFKEAALPCALLDDQLRYIACSNHWRTFHGIKQSASIVKKSISHIYDIDKKWKSILERALKGEYCSNSEERFRQKESKLHYLKWAAQPWRTADGKIAGVVIVFDSIEDLVRAREAAIHASKAKTEFVANVSHEIRTPLNGILGMLELIRQSKLDSEQSNYVETMYNSSLNLLRVINDILDCSKIEAGYLELSKEPFNLEQLFLDTVSLMKSLAKSRGLEIKILGCKSPKHLVIGDSSRIRQVLINLIGNAIRFTEYGGISVKLQFKKTKNGQVIAKVEVIDTGIGIKPVDMKRIFEPFTQVDSSRTRRHGGTGLGLSICKELITLMGGEIGVKSEVGVGSHFWFWIRLPESTQVAISKREDPSVRIFTNLPESPLGGALKILVAEDNLVNKQVVCKLLEKKGCIVDTADNGLEAFDLVKKKDYDLLIVDCQMPELDGLELARRIRSSPQPTISNIPILAMTAHAIAGDREKCLRSGIDEYLPKPATEIQLVHSIQKIFQSKKKRNEVSTTPEFLETKMFDALRQVFNSSDEFNELLADFFRTTDGAIKTMETLISLEEFKMVRATAHRTVSGCLVFGAKELANSIKEIESLHLDSRAAFENKMSIVKQAFDNLVLAVNPMNQDVVREAK